MTALEAIELKRANEERAKKAREENWKAIEKIRDDLLRRELQNAFPKPVKNITGKRQG